MKKWVYLFEEGNKDMRDLLGGKGAGLAEMANARLPVPPGFTITTEACNEYFRVGRQFPEGLWEQTLDALKTIEARTGKKLGDPTNPLLVSVRSGAKFSMPGMMDTVLNIGLNPDTLRGLAQLVGNERFAWDAYRRLIQMFGKTVKGIPGEKFEHVLTKYKAKTPGKQDTDLTAELLQEVVKDYKALYKKELGVDFPDDVTEQLRQGIEAVFASWFGKRAVDYRNFEKIPHDLGTGVSVQTMVFGNMGDDSATGVAFTRDPASGTRELYGEYLANAQGEDVVAGIRTPKQIAELKNDMPGVYRQFQDVATMLETHYRDVQDLEFTVERSKLYMLQTRTGKRTAKAAVKIAVDLVHEGLITKEEAIQRIEPGQINQLLLPRFDDKAKKSGTFLAKGLNASPGAATGVVAFDADTAEAWGKNGKAVILVRPETNPDDVHGMLVAKGILTQRGGATCVGGDTRLLTEAGFLTAEETHRRVQAGEALNILAYDSLTRQPTWRRIRQAMLSQREAIHISVSQTGRSKYDTLTITPDHKMYTLSGRQLVKKPLREVLRDNDFVCVVDRLPQLMDNLSQTQPAFLAGAIFTDGYVEVTPTKGRVVFTQKPTPEKQPFISAVANAFENEFGYGFTGRRMKHSHGNLGGRLIEGDALDLDSRRREPALRLADIRSRLVPWVLSLSEEETWQFLAGVIDGDGTLHPDASRIHIFVGDQDLLEGVVVACLKLGISPKVTRNRTIYNVQIVEQIDTLLQQTQRLQGRVRPHMYESRLLAARPLFADVVDQVNRGGKIRVRVERNLLIGVEHIQRVLPWVNDTVRCEIEHLLGSHLRMYRVCQLTDVGATMVYNFEVDADDEMDKNYIAFTAMYTPLLISNSHAAVVARGLGKPCVAGTEAIRVNTEEKLFSVDSQTIKEGDFISIDGTTGEVFAGQIATIQPDFSKETELVELLGWADAIRKLGVWANADYPKDAQKAREFGAEGIGLCRTEHMFFEQERLPYVQQMILNASEAQSKLDALARAETALARRPDSKEARTAVAAAKKTASASAAVKAYRGALAKLLPFQRKDFEGIFKVMDGLPVIIRLIDPPLHEFLPSYEELLVEVTELRARGKTGKKLRDAERMLAAVASMREMNPMLGLRGIRLGITYPDILKMQVRAIFEAACNMQAKGVKVKPEVMIPLTGHVNELAVSQGALEEVAKQVMKDKGVEVEYKFGTMIEVPRAALTAGEIARYAHFFSFGTNDLTQTTYGYSRDDAEGKFLLRYVEEKVLPSNPFQELDRDGVGKLMQMCVEAGRAARPDLEVGICGEHGGDPSSIEFCHAVGLNYVSCSPFRVPIARLAAAQAALGAVVRDK